MSHLLRIGGKICSPEAVADEIKKFCMSNLIVPEGIIEGQPLTLIDFQTDWLGRALGVDEAALSVARKNGKSSLIAAVLMYYLFSDNAIRNFKAVCGSVTGILALQLQEIIIKTARASGIGKKQLRLNTTPPPAGF